MNTELEQPPDDLVKIESKTQPSKSAGAAAILEQQLQHEIDERREERFIWIMVCTGLVDFIAFPDLAWTAVLAIFLLELVFLIGAAKWLGVDSVVILLERILEKYLPKTGDRE